MEKYLNNAVIIANLLIANASLVLTLLAIILAALILMPTDTAYHTYYILVVILVALPFVARWEGRRQ